MKSTLYLLFVLSHALAFTFWPCIDCSTSAGTISDSCTTNSDGAPYSFSCTPLDPSLPSWCCRYQINGAWVCNFASDEDDPGDTDAPDDCSMPSECGCYAPDGAKFTEGQIAGIVIGCVAGFVLLCCIWIYLRRYLRSAVGGRRPAWTVQLPNPIFFATVRVRAAPLLLHE